MKPGEAEAFTREWRLFLKRAGILTLLLIGFATYGLRARLGAPWLQSLQRRLSAPLEIPIDQAELRTKPRPELQHILEEAKVGVVGPAMKRALSEAEARGDLDRPVHGNKSLRHILAEAQALAEKARSRPRHMGLEPEDIRPEDFDPAVVVPLMIKHLQDPEPGVRMDAAMTLADKDFSRHAEQAIAYLEPLLEDTDPDVRWFAELALKRIRYFATHRKVDSFFSGQRTRESPARSE